MYISLHKGFRVEKLHAVFFGVLPRVDKFLANSSCCLFIRFSLDLDIAAPKITIPTDFCPDNTHATKLLLDLGNLMIRTQVDAPDNFFNVFTRTSLILLTFFFKCAG